MARTPPQSEPVDAKELYRRLEIVAREREARKRRSAAKRVSAVEAASNNADASHTPPPPTAFPTRPVSHMPGVGGLDSPVPPMRSADRLSTASALIPNPVCQNALAPLPPPALAFDLQDVGQPASVGTKRSSRPSTAYAQGLSDRLVFRDEGEALPGLGGKPKRPMSMSNIPASALAPVVSDASIFARPQSFVPPTLVTVQPVQIVCHDVPAPFVAPMAMAKDSYPLATELSPQSGTLDGASATWSGVSSATTALAHSASQSTSSKGDRRSWHPKHFFSKLKERSAQLEHPLPQEPPVRAVPPLHEFTLDPIPQILVADPQSVTFLHEFDFNSIPPIHEAMDLSSTSSPMESPKRRPQTTAFEPLRFSDKSDVSSARHSNPLQLGLSDMDSGLDMSDSTSNLANNFSHESIPELMPGAQRKPEQMRADSPRGECTCHPPDRGESPVTHSHRVSVLRGGLAPQQAALEYSPGLSLQAEPPGDEDVLIGSFSFQDDDQAVHTPVVEEVAVIHEPEAPAAPASDAISARASKRTTFIPEGLPARLSIPATPPTHIDDVAAVAAAVSREASLHRTASRSSMRPPSRSQPIIIAGAGAAAAGLPRALPLPPRTPPAQATAAAAGLMASPASTVMTATTGATTLLRPASRAASAPPGRLRSTSNVLVVPHPPACPAEELAMMTPECLALLRAQEQMLVRRATLLIAQAHIENTALPVASASPTPDSASAAVGRAYDEMGEIGVAVGEPPFQAPPVPPIPADDAREGAGRRRHSRRSTVASVAAAVRRSPSMSFLRPSGGGKKGAPVNGSVPAGSVSMVELHHVNGKQRDDVEKKRGGGLKKGWWKVWRLL